MSILELHTCVRALPFHFCKNVRTLPFKIEIPKSSVHRALKLGLKKTRWIVWHTITALSKRILVWTCLILLTVDSASLGGTLCKVILHTCLHTTSGKDQTRPHKKHKQCDKQQHHSGGAARPDKSMPLEGRAAFCMIFPTPPSKRLNRFNNSVFSRNWARPLVTMVAKMVFIVVGDGQ